MTECIKRETPPRVSEWSVRLGVSATRLTRAFLAQTGVAPSHYMQQARISYAKYLLRTTTLSATRIGYRAGFGTRMTFFRAFKRATGMTPESYRVQRKR